MRSSTQALWTGLVCCAAAFSAAAATAASSAPAAAKATVACSFGAFANETDPAGLNVRQFPRASAKVVGTLPPVVLSTELHGFAVKVEVEVVAADQGWFLIERARDNPQLTGQPARPMFSGRGWVHGSKLTAKSQARLGYAQPRRSAAVVVQWKDGSSFDGDLVVVVINRHGIVIQMIRHCPTKLIREGYKNKQNVNSSLGHEYDATTFLFATCGRSNVTYLQPK